MNRQSDPAEELLRRTAHRETLRNVTKQLQCLKRRYNVLYGVTGDTSSRSNQVEQVSMQQQPNSRAFILRKLKYALRTQYKDCFPLPPPNLCTVLLLFDTNEEAFFEIRLKPKAWPENWPTRLDCGSAGIDVELLSGAIYRKVLEAFNEEEAENGGTGNVLSEPSRAFGVVNRSSSGGGPRSSVVEENGLRRVIVKSEEEEIVIDDEEEEEEEEAAENNVHANEQVNRRASADQGHQETEEEDRMNYQSMFHGEDLADSASSAAAAAAAAAVAASSSSSSSAIVPPENGSPAVNPQTAADTDNSISNNNNNNTAEQQQQQQQQRQQSVNGGLTVRVRRPSERQSEEALPIKLEPTESSTTTITRVNRPPPNQAPRTGHEEAPAAAATAESASVAAPPAAAAAANVRVIQVNPPPPHHNNNNNNDGTTPLGQQRQQQQPPAAVAAAAAAAAVTARGTLTMRPTANSSIFHIVRSKRPADHSKAAQPSHSHSQPAQDNPKRAKVSTGSASLVSRSSAAASAKRRAAAAATATATSTARTLQPQQHRPSSTSTHAVTAANVEAYLRAHCPSYFSVKNTQTKVQCPDCPKPLTKYLLKDHLLWLHHGLKPYHCRWPGCSFTTGWRSRAAYHVKDFHRGNYAQYIEYREE